MKKIISIFTIILLTITITGCGTKKEENIKGTLPDLMKKLYEGVDIQNLDQQVVTEEKMEYMLGSKNLDIKEAYYSEPLMTSVAHSVVLARANDGADISKIKQEIKEKINPHKWICVEVYENHIHVENRGNLIILIMDNTNDEQILNNFNNL